MNEIKKVAENEKSYWIKNKYNASLLNLIN